MVTGLTLYTAPSPWFRLLVGTGNGLQRVLKLHLFTNVVSEGRSLEERTGQSNIRPAHAFLPYVFPMLIGRYDHDPATTQSGKCDQPSSQVS